MLKATALLSLVILIAGCTDLDFGDTEISVSTPVTDEGTRNVILVKDINTIPKSPILPSDTVDFSFIVENVDKEKIESVIVNLFDAAGFYGSTSAGKCNSDFRNCLPDGMPATSCGADGCSFGTLSPGAQKLINYQIKAPTEQDILKLPTMQELRFSVEYRKDGKTTYRPVMVDINEIRALQRAGQQVNVESSTAIGNGPVKINLALKNRNFMLSSRPATFEAVVEHVGAGRVKNNAISAGALEITIVDIDCNNIRGSDLIGLAKNIIKSVNGNCVLYNTEQMDFINEGKTMPVLFTVEDVKLTQGVPYRSYEIRATVVSHYRVTGSTSVQIKPAEV